MSMSARKSPASSRKSTSTSATTVKKGQLLAEIDPRVYQAQVEAGEAHLNSLRAQLNQQKAAAVLAEQNLKRNQNLIAANAVSQQALQETESQAAVARAQVDSIAAQMQETESNLKASRTNLGFTKIFAPMDGTVTTLPTKEGQTLNANQTTPTVMQVANLDVMTVRAQVAEADVTRIKENMPAYFTTLGDSETRWQGTVRQVQPSPEIVNDVVLYDVLIDVKNEGHKLMTGMTTQVFFIFGKADNAVIVPAEVLTRRVAKEDNDKGKAYRVTVVTDKGREQRVIHVGLQTRTQAEVIDGLQEGEKLAGNRPAGTPNQNNQANNQQRGNGAAQRAASYPRTTAMNATILELHDIHKHYQNGDTTVRALDGVSLTIQRGEFVAIMGQSGSGKSTLMNIIGCLDRPTTGSYLVLGKEAANLEPDELASLRRETFGFIFQRYNLLATATAEENVAIPSVYAGLPKQQRKTHAKELLKRLGLGDRTDHRPSELSGGQQQRVAIARALVNDPPVILADEPTGALDSKSGDEVLALLKQLHAEGRTIILITHAENVAQHAGRIVRIQDGRIIEDTGVNLARARHLPQVQELNLSSAVSLVASMQEALVTAGRSLRVNIFRTILTLLGIIIGVAAVVAMLAVGEGSRQKVLDRISSFGTNLMLIRPGAAGIRNAGDIATLVPDDAAAIKALPNIEAALPERNGRATVRFGNIDYQTSMQGTGEDFPSARDWPVAEGQFFNADDMKHYAAVVVLGRTVAKTLFPGGDSPVGKYVLMKNVPFLVIGVMSEKGASPNGSDQDDVIFVPITTGLVRLFGKNYLSSITIKVKDSAEIEATQQSVETLLKARHKTEDFSVRNMASFLQAAMETQDTFTFLLGTVAAISLLVGGIGVMNIMLVSVVERTREIGIRMATGARMRDIMLQFNIEAAVVCATGGILGILVGVLAGLVLRYSGMSVIFSVTPALLAFACASATGLIFGYLPARQAAQLDPVVALASE